MPTKTPDQTSFDRLQIGGDGVPRVIPKVPTLPEDVRKRFPSLVEWEKQMEEWRVKATRALTGG